MKGVGDSEGQQPSGSSSKTLSGGSTVSPEGQKTHTPGARCRTVGSGAGSRSSPAQTCSREAQRAASVTGSSPVQCSRAQGRTSQPSINKEKSLS